MDSQPVDQRAWWAGGTGLDHHQRPLSLPARPAAFAGGIDGHPPARRADSRAHRALRHRRLGPGRIPGADRPPPRAKPDRGKHFRRARTGPGWPWLGRQLSRAAPGGVEPGRRGRTGAGPSRRIERVLSGACGAGSLLPVVNYFTLFCAGAETIPLHKNPVCPTKMFWIWSRKPLSSSPHVPQRDAARRSLRARRAGNGGRAPG